MFDALPRAAKVAMVRSVVEQMDKEQAVYQALRKAYLERDLAALLRIAGDSEAGEKHAFTSAFMQAGIVERNRRMVRRMLPALKKGGVFVAVGALHLPGEQGILNLLEQAGYTVKPVY